MLVVGSGLGDDWKQGRLSLALELIRQFRHLGHDCKYPCGATAMVEMLARCR